MAIRMCHNKIKVASRIFHLTVAILCEMRQKALSQKNDFQNPEITSFSSTGSTQNLPIDQDVLCDSCFMRQ